MKRNLIITIVLLFSISVFAASENVVATTTFSTLNWIILIVFLLGTTVVGELVRTKAKGEVTVPRDNVLFFETNTEGEFIFNTSRVLGFDPLNPFDVSKAETMGRGQCVEIYKFLKNYAPGFENATFISTAPHIGIRESRHPHAKYVLSAEDLVNEVKFENPIAVGGYPLDIHSPDGGTTDTVHLKDDGAYYIPTDSLLVNEVDNLVLSGRAIGADHHASAGLRVTPIAMAIGQGAGTLAGLAAVSHLMPNQVEYAKLK